MQDNKGASHEIAFWKQFIQSDRFINGWLSNDKTPELNDLVYMFLLGQPEAKVLDCGSGVVSILHGTVPKENLTACDLLGTQYDKIFDYEKHGLMCPAPVACENIPFDSVFDIVHISNAIDHVQDPFKAYAAMLRAVKPGGFLVVQGFVNEGTHENWEGFHGFDFNLTVHGGLIGQNQKEVVLWVEDNTYFSRKIHIEMLNREWFIHITRKPLEV